MASAPNKIRIISLDFDGCLFNLSYLGSDDKDIIKYNKKFIDKLNAENISFNKVFTMVGSNRQSYAKDKSSSFNNHAPSCFPAIATITGNIDKAILDNYLMADLFNDLDDGSAYKDAIENPFSFWDLSQQEHPHHKFDDTKASLLYAQIHRAAINNPEAEIVFDFYDDRHDILYSLNNFFTQHQQVPQNITLRLHQYAGDEVKTIADIKGTCEVDTNYARTVKNLFKITPTAEKAAKERGISHLITSENLAACKTNSLITETKAPDEDVARPLPTLDPSNSTVGMRRSQSHNSKLSANGEKAPGLSDPQAKPVRRSVSLTLDLSNQAGSADPCSEPLAATFSNEVPVAARGRANPTAYFAAAAPATPRGRAAPTDFFAAAAPATSRGRAAQTDFFAALAPATPRGRANPTDFFAAAAPATPRGREAPTDFFAAAAPATPRGTRRAVPALDLTGIKRNAENDCNPEAPKRSKSDDAMSEGESSNSSSAMHNPK